MTDGKTRCISRAFDSYEALAEQATSWDIDFIQLTPAPFHAEFLQSIRGDFQFTKSYFANHLHQQGTAPPGKITFTLHHWNSVPNTWRYLPCPLNSITVYPDNNELQSVSKPGMHKFTLSFAEEFLQSISGNIGLPPLDEYMTRGGLALCEPTQLSYLQNYLTGLTHHLYEGQRRGDAAPIAEEVIGEVARLLLIILAAADQGHSDRKRSKRAEAVEKITCLLHSRRPVLPAVGELCSATGLGETRLRDLFQEVFHTDPENYLESYGKSGS